MDLPSNGQSIIDENHHITSPVERNVLQSNCGRPQNEIGSTSKDETEIPCHESTMRQLSEFQCIMNNQSNEASTDNSFGLKNQIDEPIGSNCLGHSSCLHSMATQSLQPSDHHNFNQCHHHHFPVQVPSSYSEQIEDIVSKISFSFVLFDMCDLNSLET